MEYKNLVGSIYAMSQQSEQEQTFARTVWILDPTLEMNNKQLGESVLEHIETSYTVPKSTTIADVLMKHCDPEQSITHIVKEAAESYEVEPKYLQNSELKQFVRD